MISAMVGTVTLLLALVALAAALEHTQRTAGLRDPWALPGAGEDRDWARTASDLRTLSQADPPRSSGGQALEPVSGPRTLRWCGDHLAGDVLPTPPRWR